MALCRCAELSPFGASSRSWVALPYRLAYRSSSPHEGIVSWGDPTHRAGARGNGRRSLPPCRRVRRVLFRPTFW